MSDPENLHCCKETSVEIYKLQEQIQKIEETLLEVRDIARDAKHISIGVDGKNGLRGTLQKLSEEVEYICKEFTLLKDAADNYKEAKHFVLKLFTASLAAVLVQFSGAVWYLSGQHSKQEALREDVNRLMAYIDKSQTNTTQQSSK